MRKSLFGCLLLAALAAGAEELTVNSILMAHRAGAPPDGIIAMVNNPANTITMNSSELVTLRAAGVSESVITAITARMPAPTPTPVPLTPDDPRLVDLVRLIKSGLSESIVAGQIKQSGQVYNLSVNDLMYLKQTGVQESTISVLMATAAAGGTSTAPRASGAAAPAVVAAVPKELVFDGLVLQKATFLKKNRPGRLTLTGEVFSWVDGTNPKENFEFQLNGLEKLWLTCQARTPENFCYQLSFQIVKGARYRFQDLGRESGSNTAVLKVMEALRTHHPALPFGPPDVEN